MKILTLFGFYRVRVWSTYVWFIVVMTLMKMSCFYLSCGYDLHESLQHWIAFEVPSSPKCSGHWPNITVNVRSTFSKNFNFVPSTFSRKKFGEKVGGTIYYVGLFHQLFFMLEEFANYIVYDCKLQQ